MILKKENTALNRLLSKKPNLNKYDLDDFSCDLDLDHLTELVASICQTPIAHVSIFEKHKVLLAAKFGIDASLTSLDRKDSFCQYTVLEDEIMEVSDASNDKRFTDNPFVVGHPNVRFYAGMSLISPEGIKIGTLCVLDVKPKLLSEETKKILALSRRSRDDQFRA